MESSATNLLQGISRRQLGALAWEREPERWEILSEGGLRVAAPARTDAFRNPNGDAPRLNVPFLSLEVEGDFAARARVRPTFASTYDAGALMVYQDEARWAKVCYESTDFGTHAVVSVVTDGLSDDANGVDLAVDEVWLQIVRVGNVFAMHYALDGRDWRMVRYFSLPLPARVRVGLVAQSPVGPGTTVDFHAFSVERRSVKSLRAGV